MMKQTVCLKNITRKSGFRFKLTTVGEVHDDLSNDGVVESDGGTGEIQYKFYI